MNALPVSRLSPLPGLRCRQLQRAGCRSCLISHGTSHVIFDPHGMKCQNESQGHPRNYSWVELMKRVFGFDVLKCDSCGGRMRILCAINPPVAIKKILDCLGLPSRPPPISPAVLLEDCPYIRNVPILQQARAG